MLMDVSQLPFNSWLGLTLCDDKVCLQPTPQHLNHIGTVHAAVILLSQKLPRDTGCRDGTPIWSSHTWPSCDNRKSSIGSRPLVRSN